MPENSDKPTFTWPPSLADFVLRCSTCPNSKEVTFTALAAAFGVTTTTLGEWIAKHCADIDGDYV